MDQVSKKNMKGAIAVFCKTIGLSPVKTRLAKDIGKLKAEEFYKLSLSAIEEVVLNVKQQCDIEIDPYWASAEKEAADDPVLIKFPTIWTGEGGLGERMFNIHSRLLTHYDFVILIGSDSPHMTPKILLDAISLIKLYPNSHIFGPAYDGGFYLYLSTEELPLDIWNDVTYSLSTTREELTSLIKNEGYKVIELEFMHDVDDLSDLKVLKKELLEHKDLLPKQNNIKYWIFENTN